jgi:hypothetical protein
METSHMTDLCRQMNEVRCNLGDDVEQLVESARNLSDWHTYVREHPWICLAGAAVAGYLIVPKRVELISPSADALEQLAKRNKLVVTADPQPQVRSGLGGALFGLVASAAVRGLLGYAGQNAGRYLGGVHNPDVKHNTGGNHNTDGVLNTVGDHTGGRDAESHS